MPVTETGNLFLRRFPKQLPVVNQDEIIPRPVVF
jgi:hypothetical protein